jgi:methionine sulfoxide reductase heme-binding subunit
MGRKAWPLMALAALGAIALGLGGLYYEHDAAREGFAAATRFTARWSLAWFAAAWSASSLARLWRGGWRAALMRNRRGVGLGFAMAHFVHAFFFITNIVAFGRMSSLVTIIGGGAGYVFVALMAATSNDWSVNKLGPRWKLLHAIGGYYIAFIFAFTYYGALHREPVIAAIGLAVIGAAAFARLCAWAFARRRQAA